MATTLALPTQRGYNVYGCRMNCKHLQSKVFQRQPGINALRRGSMESRFEC